MSSIANEIQKPRHVFVSVPLRVIRAHCTRDPFLGPILEFLDRVFPIEQEEIVQTDTMIPSIVYIVAYQVTDEDWASYGQVLQVFQFTGALKGMLEEVEFDSMPKNEWLFQQANAELDDILQRLVQWMNLGDMYDVSNPWQSQAGKITSAASSRNCR
jgi:hypothetical protein